MKNYFFLLIVFFAVSCNSNCDCKMGEKNLVTVQALYEAFGEGNVDGVVAGMASDVVWNEAENFIYADGNPYEGPDAVVEGIFARIGAEWEFWNLEDKIFKAVEGDQVLVTGRYKAKNKSTAKDLDAQFAHIWTVKGGKIASFQQYADTKQAAEAIVPTIVESDLEE